MLGLGYRAKHSMAGADDVEVTPVPIPNTEVKLDRAENTWLATAWEDRAMPVQMNPLLSG